MKRLAILAVAGCLMLPSLGYAETEGCATATVYATVMPNVAVAANTPIVDAGTVQTGDFTAMIEFQVDANKQEVQLSVCASELWKGDDPTGLEVLPIPLNLSAGVVIAPTNANPVGGGSNVANYVGPGDPIDGFECQATEAILFESSQNNRFSQPVYVTVTWTQDDNEKPMGQYSGKVRLCAVLLP